MPRHRAFAFLVVAFVARAQEPPASLNEALEAVFRSASNFAGTAPGLMADESLEQRGRRSFREVLTRAKKKTKLVDIKLPAEFQTHQVTASWGLAAVGEARVLHEVRKIVARDGKTIADDEDARHALTAGLRSGDDGIKRTLLEDFENSQMEGAVTDFSQLILLFTEAHRKDYQFSRVGGSAAAARISPGRGQPEDGEDPAEPVVVIAYRQTGGDHGVTIFDERTEERAPTSGQIWLRARDLVPLRITLVTEQVTSKKFVIRTVATVNYTPSAFGLVPDSVTHQQFLNADLMVENKFHYTGFHRADMMIP